MNRKLIRPTLAEVRNKARDTTSSPSKTVATATAVRPAVKENPLAPAPVATPSSGVQVRKRQPPPAETYAELYYYKKQIDAHTLMVIVLQDDEEIEGTIEWYDRNALKVNRHTEPNLLLLKHNIKYMYKAEDRDSTGPKDDAADE